MQKIVLPDQDFLRQVIEYDPRTGRLTWRLREASTFCGAGKRTVSIWNARYAGRDAMTTVGADGYCKGSLNGIKVLAHRVIWKWMAGQDADYIDHINGNRTDNRWCNLRNVAFEDNTRNACRSRANTSGVTGVAWERSTGKWLARIGRSGKIERIGTFSSFDEAVAARKAAEAAYGYHPNHGRIV